MGYPLFIRKENNMKKRLLYIKACCIGIYNLIKLMFCPNIDKHEENTDITFYDWFNGDIIMVYNDNGINYNSFYVTSCKIDKTEGCYYITGFMCDIFKMEYIVNNYFKNDRTMRIDHNELFLYSIPVINFKISFTDILVTLAPTTVYYKREYSCDVILKQINKLFNHMSKGYSSLTEGILCNEFVSEIDLAMFTDNLVCLDYIITPHNAGVNIFNKYKK